jgi:hypothetical protein
MNRKRQSSESSDEPERKRIFNPPARCPSSSESSNSLSDSEVSSYSPESGNYTGSDTSSFFEQPPVVRSPSLPRTEETDNSLLDYVLNRSREVSPDLEPTPGHSGTRPFFAIRSTPKSPPPSNPFKDLTQVSRFQKVQIWLGLVTRSAPNIPDSDLEDGELPPSEPEEASLISEISGLTGLESLRISTHEDAISSVAESEVFTPDMMEWINGVLEEESIDSQATADFLTYYKRTREIKVERVEETPTQLSPELNTPRPIGPHTPEPLAGYSGTRYQWMSPPRDLDSSSASDELDTSYTTTSATDSSSVSDSQFRYTGDHPLTPQPQTLESPRSPSPEPQLPIWTITKCIYCLNIYLPD